MKLKKIFEKFNINTENIPQTILNYDTQNYEKMHTETIDEYKKVIVFTKQTETILYEGIFDTDNNKFTQFTKHKGSDTRYSYGGVDEKGIFL